MDVFRNSHPVEVPISNALEVMQRFDAISFSKGASAIRMIGTELTDKDFFHRCCKLPQEGRFLQGYH